MSDGRKSAWTTVGVVGMVVVVPVGIMILDAIMIKCGIQSISNYVKETGHAEPLTACLIGSVYGGLMTHFYFNQVTTVVRNRWVIVASNGSTRTIDSEPGDETIPPEVGLASRGYTITRS